MRAYIIRHGETEWNGQGRIQGSADVPLNETGIAQMNSLASLVREFELSPFILASSDLNRCKTSAEIVGRPWGITPLLLIGLREVDFGVWTGCRINELRDRVEEREAWDRMKTDYVWKGGESFRAAHSKAQNSMEALRSENPDSNIVVVTHGIIVQLLVSWWLSGTLDCVNRLTISNGSLSVVDLPKVGSSKCLSINLVPIETDSSAPKSIPDDYTIS